MMTVMRLISIMDFKVRDAWIEAREDVEHYEGRRIQSIDNGFQKKVIKLCNPFEYQPRQVKTPVTLLR